MLAENSGRHDQLIEIFASFEPPVSLKILAFSLGFAVAFQEGI